MQKSLTQASENPFKEKTQAQISQQMNIQNNKKDSVNSMYVTAEGFGKAAQLVNKVDMKQAMKEKENESAAALTDRSTCVPMQIDIKNNSEVKSRQSTIDINANQAVPIGPQRTKEQVQPRKNQTCDEPEQNVEMEKEDQQEAKSTQSSEEEQLSPLKKDDPRYHAK